jgi:hypothetical protein
MNFEPVTLLVTDCANVVMPSECFIHTVRILDLTVFSSILHGFV